MILAKRKIRDSILTFVKLDNDTYVHLSDFIRLYDDVKDRSFEYENYSVDFLEKIFWAFRKDCQSILVRENSFRSGCLTHKYSVNTDKKEYWLGEVNRYLTDLKVFNVMQKKWRKIKNF